MKKSTNYLSLAIKVILLISILNSINLQLWHIMSTNIFLLILVYIPQIFKRVKIKFPKQFEWILLIFVIITLFLGKIGGIVAPIMFGVGIAFIGFIFSMILYSTNRIKQNYLLISFFSFNLAIAFGTALELAKYYLKLIIGQTISASTYAFSMSTLTYVLIGALISSLLGYIYMKTNYKPLKKLVKKFKLKNPEVFKKSTNEEDLKEYLKKGENEILEFKSTLRTNLHTNQPDKNIEHSIIKTISAFLNSKGGELLIGLTDQGEVTGIQKDNFPNKDKFNLHLTNLIKQKLGKDKLNLISIENLKVKEKVITLVNCKPSKKPIFLKQNQIEEFYIRTGPATTSLTGSELINYVKRRFEK